MARARRRRVSGLVLAAALAMLAPAASADIRAFNAAVTAGDYRAASAAAAETWPALDKAAPDIAVVAREFAWVSMLAGDPGKAQAYTSFLIARASTLGPGDPSQITWRVLDAWAAFAVRPASDTRKALADALTVRAAITGKDLISLRAAQALFQDEWDRGLWRDAAAIAESGAHIARDFDRGFVDVVYQLETGRLAASFADRATNEAALYLNDLALRVYAEAMTETDALLAAVPDDHAQRIRRQLARRSEDVRHERPPREEVQHFRARRIHARALAGCHHDDL